MNKTKIINEALAIPRIGDRVKDLKITKKQLEEAIIILLDIIQENLLEREPKYLTSFNISGSGKLVPTKVLSNSGKKSNFMHNLVTQDITPININLRIKDIEQTKDRYPIALYLKGYKKEFANNPKGFYLYGAMGIGKSYVAQAMANTLAEKGFSVAFLNVVDLSSAAKSKFSSGFDSFLLQLKTVDHLFLDDLGAEIVSPWFRDELLLSVLSSRMNNNKSTFITSNFSYKDLEIYESRTKGEKYPNKNKSARLLERVKALTVPIHITGKNRRY